MHDQNHHLIRILHEDIHPSLHTLIYGILTYVILMDTDTAKARIEDMNQLVQVTKDRMSINHRNPHPLLENHSIQLSLIQGTLTH